MNKRKIIIGIFIIIIVIIILIIALLFQKNKKNINVIESSDSEEIQEKEFIPMPAENTVAPNESTKTIENIWYNDNYFNAKIIIEDYYSLFNSYTGTDDIDLPRSILQADESTRNNYINEQKENRQLAFKESLYNMYSNEYKKEFNIKENNIKLDSKDADYTKIIISKMYQAGISNSITVYIVSGKRINVKNSSNKDFYVMVAFDYSTMSYSIYPEEYVTKHRYNKLKIGDKIDIKIDTIENNEYNSFSGQTFSEQNICKEYLENLGDRIVYEIDDIYGMLDSEYAKKRFGSKNAFNEYLKDIKETFSNNSLKEYSVVSSSDYKDYICTDRYDNTYIFRSKNNILNYTIFLDKYTIISSSDLSTYGKINAKQKSRYNLNRFTKMINTKDYNAIYNVLDSTFKSNNFKNVNDLKKYIKNNFYSVNNITIESEEEKDNYYVYKCKMTNWNYSEESKKINIIISKTDGLDFKISFSFES